MQYQMVLCTFKIVNKLCRALMQRIFVFILDIMNQNANACCCLELNSYIILQGATKFLKYATVTSHHKWNHIGNHVALLIFMCLAKIHQRRLLHAVALCDAPQQFDTVVTKIQKMVDKASEVYQFIGWAIADLLLWWRKRTDKNRGKKNKIPASHILQCLMYYSIAQRFNRRWKL